MPACGGKAPYPRRMGGGKTLVATILESLNQQRGTAYDVSESSPVYAENMAMARALANAWSTNQRLANQADPLRMTDTLPRWEKILDLHPLPTDTEPVRRAAVAKAFERIGKTFNRSRLQQLVERELGPFYLGTYYIPLALAIVTVPDSSYPFGTPNPDYPWSSNACKVLIHVQKPAGYSWGDFLEVVGRLGPVLDQALTAWQPWDWYVSPSLYAPVNVVNGPVGAGFYLDDEHNLDFEIFDV